MGQKNVVVIRNRNFCLQRESRAAKEAKLARIVADRIGYKFGSSKRVVEVVEELDQTFWRQR
jgi:hypothetical protein